MFSEKYWHNKFRNDGGSFVLKRHYPFFTYCSSLFSPNLVQSPIASWLLGETVTLTEIQPSELSLDPIRADAMILLQSEDSILHIEFQTIPKENIPFRMLDYRVRGNRRYKGKPMRQVVIYLKPTTSELAYQTSYDLERTHHEFDVVRLWEQPADLFLQYPGLLPFAALGQSESPA
jgi:predicted transposase/invertase (TIGR01784 family)